MTLQYIEEQVARVLRDVKPSAAPAPALGSNEDVVASMVSFFTEQKKCSFPATLGKFQSNKVQGNDSHSPIKKKAPTHLLSSTVWAKMSEVAKDQFLQEKR